MQFPHVQQYIDILAARDQGVLMVSMMAFAAVICLGLGRFQFPKLMPLLRIGSVVLYFVVLATSIVLGVTH